MREPLDRVTVFDLYQLLFVGLWLTTHPEWPWYVIFWPTMAQVGAALITALDVTVKDRRKK